MAEELSSAGAVFVAGGTGGLGRAVSLAFLSAGAAVVVTYRQQEEFDTLLKEAGAGGGRLDGHIVDVTDEAATNELAKSIIGKHARLAAVVNTIGGYDGGARLWELETPVLERMLALNLRAGYALAKAMIPVMLRQGHGSFVNIAAKAAIDHPPGAAAYAASKAAALALMDSLAAELLGTGVRVNSVLPSVIDTAANRRAMPKANFAKWPKPDEIAPVIQFLCSDAAAVIHGAAIPVYGAR